MFRRPLHNTLQASFICFYGLLPRLLPRRKGNADLFPFFLCRRRRRRRRRRREMIPFGA